MTITISDNELAREVSITVDVVSIGEYVDAVIDAALAWGFHPDTVKDYMPSPESEWHYFEECIDSDQSETEPVTDSDQDLVMTVLEIFKEGLALIDSDQEDAKQRVNDMSTRGKRSDDGGEREGD